MKKIFLLFCLITAGAHLAAQNSEKVVRIQKFSETIRIDGIIDPVWAQADSISDFTQFAPYYNTEPSKKTVAKLLTTDKNLYCLMVCYDDRKNIQSFKGTLDNTSGDVVSLMLDTFGNGRTAYKFAVTASGVRSDCRLLDDARNRDYTWDGIWFADAKMYDWGFVVEMEIPYKSLQYDESLTEWGLDFDRDITKITEYLYWCQYEENEGLRVSKFGKLVFDGFRPTVKGIHLELYPVGIAKATYQGNNKYNIDPDAGIDIFYNPSPKLTFQLTANPDFAQIEADPFQFNISRYETYFSERRPFFTEGNEIFMAAGRQRNTGFYTPLELLYSRRIGKKLPDGSEVPILVGTKTFGRIKNWEYGGFVAMTGEKKYSVDDSTYTEASALFGSARIKKQILGNSSVGLLFVGKHDRNGDSGVLDIDGAFRTSDWQLAYQIAGSFKGSQGDYAASAGFTMFKEKSMVLIRGRFIGSQFDIDDVGFVPWLGTSQIVAIGGPRWYFENGYIQSILFYGGPYVNYEKVDSFTDYGGILGFNMQFRNNWGYKIGFDMGEAMELNEQFTSYSINLSSWMNMSAKWNGSLGGGHQKTYNFTRDYLAYYSWFWAQYQWQIFRSVQIGTSANMFVEWNPEGDVEDITYNTRPFISATPVNNLNIRIYLDNVLLRSSGHFEQLIGGFLFSYNFSPKSWIYFAVNEIQARPNDHMEVLDRAGVLKLKYLYFF
jgi:hypothetical protein